MRCFVCGNRLAGTDCYVAMALWGVALLLIGVATGMSILVLWEVLST